MINTLNTNHSGDRYLNFVKRRLSLPTFQALYIDSGYTYILDIIYINYFNLKPLTVSQLMAKREIGSSATIHRKLNHLREIGIIENFTIGKNNRTKYLRPTKNTIISCDALMDTTHL